MKTNEQGRSMVEMLGVLAIIGVLSAGGLAGYSKAMFKHKLNSTMDQITMLVTNIRTMYGTQGNYKDLDNDAAVDLGIVPPVMVGTKGTEANAKTPLTNPFKGKVTIAALATLGQVTYGGFTIEYDGLPVEACIALATADFGSGAGSGFIGAKINNVDPSGEYGNANSHKEGDAYTMEGALAAGACDQNTNKIVWTFY